MKRCRPFLQTKAIGWNTDGLDDQGSPPCRVSSGFEPAYAGGLLIVDFHLASPGEARGYRVVRQTIATLRTSVGSKRRKYITYTAGLYGVILTQIGQICKLHSGAIVEGGRVIMDEYTKS